MITKLDDNFTSHGYHFGTSTIIPPKSTKTLKFSHSLKDE